MVIYMCVCVYVAIHAQASMPLAPRLSEADSKTSEQEYHAYMDDAAMHVQVPPACSLILHEPS
jgi:hypothetical protein